MAVRPEMQPLIDRLRLMVNERPNPATPNAPVAFTDEDLQGFLDANRLNMNTAPHFLYGEPGPIFDDLPTDGAGFVYDLNGAAADTWRVKAGNTLQWKGQFAQYANEQVKRYERLRWGRNGNSYRV